MLYINLFLEPIIFSKPFAHFRSLMIQVEQRDRHWSCGQVVSTSFHQGGNWVFMFCGWLKGRHVSILAHLLPGFCVRFLGYINNNETILVATSDKWCQLPILLQHSN